MRSDGVATQDFSQSSTTLRHCYFARRARPGEAGRFGDVEAEPCVPENGDAHTLARLHRARAEVLQHEKASTARAFARNTPPRRAETDRKPRKAPIISTYKKNRDKRAEYWQVYAFEIDAALRPKHPAPLWNENIEKGEARVSAHLSFRGYSLRPERYSTIDRVVPSHMIWRHSK